MKRVIVLFLAFIFVLSICFPAVADDDSQQYVYDYSNVLLNSFDDLNQRLINIHSNYTKDVFIYIDAFDEDSIQNSMDDFLIDNNILIDNHDFCVFAIDSNSKKLNIFQYGNEEIFIDEERNFLTGKFQVYIEKQTYYQSIWLLLNLVDGFFDQDILYNDFFWDYQEDISPYIIPKTKGFVPQYRGLPYIVDEANLLNEFDRDIIEDKLQTASNECNCDIAIVTVPSLGFYSDCMNFADDYFDYNGFGFEGTDNGVVLLISMENRDWYISTSGLAIQKISNNSIQNIGENFVSYLSDGDYYGGFYKYISECEAYLTGNISYNHNPESNDSNIEDVIVKIIICLGIGLLFGLVLVSRLKAQLKSVHYQPDANNYLRSGSFYLTNSNDLFLYSHVSKTRRQTESSSSGGGTHVSSSGSSHGGGGGHF